MNNKVWFKILLSVILVVALVSAGVWLFNMGVVRGAATNGELPTVGGQTVLPYAGMMGGYRQGFEGNGRQGMMEYGYGMHPFFSPFRFLGGLIFFFFILALFRAIFFGGWAGRGHYHGFHRCGMGHYANEDGIPPMVEEWHKKMHDKETPPEK
jgi:hypothetical protein